MIRSRFRQADREACITLALYAGFFVWWTVGAFGLGDAAMTPVFGMPAWFFVSCVLGYPVACVALWLVVRRCFVDVPLDALVAAEVVAEVTSEGAALKTHAEHAASASISSSVSASANAQSTEPRS